MSNRQSPGPVREVVDRLEEIGDTETLPLGRLIEAFGRTSFVPALMVPALLVVSPLSGIPMFSTICGLGIAMIAVQMVFGRSHLWLPNFVQNRCLKGAVLGKAMKRMHRVSDLIDRFARDRFQLLVKSPGNRVPHIMCLIAGLSMPVLEVVPFSSSIMGAVVLCCAVGLLARDGLFVLLGGVLMSGVAGLAIFAYRTIFG